MEHAGVPVDLRRDCLFAGGNFRHCADHDINWRTIVLFRLASSKLRQQVRNQEGPACPGELLFLHWPLVIGKGTGWACLRFSRRRRLSHRAKRMAAGAVMEKPGVGSSFGAGGRGSVVWPHDLSPWLVIYRSIHHPASLRAVFDE